MGNVESYSADHIRKHVKYAPLLDSLSLITYLTDFTGR